MVLHTKPKRAVPAHHRKRQGQHHKQTKRYAKTYWPYLPLLCIAVAGIIINAAWGSMQHKVLPYATEMSVSTLLQNTNVQRSGNGVATLSLNSLLTAAAQAKANDMATRDYWSHNTPEGSAPWVFITQAGYNYTAAGENLAYGFDSSGATVSGWMNSPEHKANLLNGNYTEAGFGIANTTNYQGTGPETIVVAMYGKPRALAAAQPAAPQQPAAPAPSTPAPAPAATPAAPTPTSSPASPSSGTQNSLPKNTPLQSKPAATPAAPAEKQVSRIQLVSKGAAPWSAFALSTLTTVAIVLFFIKHGLLWHRVLRRGERFMVTPHLLDIILVAIGVLGFVLTRSAGTIH